ncbi:MAG TPA: cytochrome P450 [Alphaproteobacteria bacterium]|nr:cytochrome P450 [Alphaproteobacteria bacterium]
MAKPIPKMLLIPREISLNHIVSRVIPAFETHGDVFQLVLPVPLKIFCLRKPDHIKAVSAREECATRKPPHLIPKADYFMGNGVYNDLGGNEWKAKRRVLNPAFTMESSIRVSERLPGCIDRMLSRWGAGPETPRDLYAELQRMVLDFGAAALFSTRFEDDELGWIVEATTFSETMFTTLTPYWIPTPSNLKFQRIKARYHAIMDRIISARRMSGDHYPDMLRVLLDTPNLTTNRPHTDEEIKSQILSAYFGTPAVTLTILWGLFFLSTRPEMLRKLRIELNSVLGSRSPTAQDLRSLPYLGMIIDEVLRYYPSFWGSLRYAEQPIEIDGYAFPAKSHFAMIRYAAHRHPDHWENPDAFIPERHEQRNACPHALLPFGLGPRTCLGNSLARIVAPLAVASIIQNFDIRFQSEDVRLKYGFGIYPANRMWGTVRPIKSAAADPEASLKEPVRAGQHA